MAENSIDPALVNSWLAARSLIRGLPTPVPDRGGLRVDTNSEDEARRWVFSRMSPELIALAAEVSAPKHFIKLCGSRADLRNALPSHWEMQPSRYLMTANASKSEAKCIPENYRLTCFHSGPMTHIQIIAPDGSLAASGYSAETDDVYIYDRIETAFTHRRMGLGTALMNALGSLRNFDTLQLLVATENGRELYEKLGWTVISPYETAVTRTLSTAV